MDKQASTGNAHIKAIVATIIASPLLWVLASYVTESFLMFGNEYINFKVILGLLFGASFLFLRWLFNNVLATPAKEAKE